MNNQDERVGFWDWAEESAGDVQTGMAHNHNASVTGMTYSHTAASYHNQQWNMSLEISMPVGRRTIKCKIAYFQKISWPSNTKSSADLYASLLTYTCDFVLSFSSAWQVENHEYVKHYDLLFKAKGLNVSQILLEAV